uniref:Ig-like domain-containing protein n=1 Tax=Lepisosteus oculatus TaxID=7918 RepID=W5MY95_LEPOC
MKGIIFLISDLTQTEEVTQPGLIQTTLLGSQVTLHCYLSKEKADYTVWLKQRIGQKPQYIAMYYSNLKRAMFYDQFKDNPRFMVKNDKKQFHLMISRTQPSDTAMYYCGIIRTSHVHFGNGTFLKIQGSELIRWSVTQQLVSVPVQPGDNVTLQCTIHTETCPDQHDVYWFRNSSKEPFPKIIYTNGSKSDQECERNSLVGFHTQCCVYNLPKMNLSHSDAGTYYCAVATCDGLLFGNGTLLEITASVTAQTGWILDPLVIGLLVSNAVCVTVISVLVYG